MFTIAFWQQALLQVWQAGRAPIVAAGVALAAWLLGRLLRLGWLQAAAAGLGLAAGWALGFGPPALAPRLPAERLPVLAASALATGLAVDLSGRPIGLAGLAFSLLAGWWLAGAPRSEAEAAIVLPVMASLCLAMLLALRLLRAPSGPWSTPAAALALWAALGVAGAPALWTGVALVPVAAALGQVAAPRGAAAVRLPMAAGLAGVAGLAVLVLGRFGRSGLSRFDLAALAPLLAVWAVRRLAARLPWAGGLAAGLAGAVLAVALIAAASWAAVRLGMLR